MKNYACTLSSFIGLQHKNYTNTYGALKLISFFSCFLFVPQNFTKTQKNKILAITGKYGWVTKEKLLIVKGGRRKKLGLSSQWIGKVKGSGEEHGLVDGFLLFWEYLTIICFKRLQILL